MTFPRPGDRVPFAPSPHPSLTILSNFNFNPSVEGNSLFNNLVTALLSRWNEGWKFVDCFQPLLEEGTVKKDELSSVKNIRHESFSLNLRDTESRTIHSYCKFSDGSSRSTSIADQREKVALGLDDVSIKSESSCSSKFDCESCDLSHFSSFLCDKFYGVIFAST